jgi:hypothetical protein
MVLYFAAVFCDHQQHRSKVKEEPPLSKWISSSFLFLISTVSLCVALSLFYLFVYLFIFFHLGETGPTFPRSVWSPVATAKIPKLAISW